VEYPHEQRSEAAHPLAGCAQDRAARLNAHVVDAGYNYGLSPASHSFSDASL
jgi:hypothetical protein